ncbi:MAG: hypothetical protein FJ148_06610 [Deltaproteobacteria bacterium]|nr:hypothetical protein [Deltaproteobacteria bacterium]
MLQPVNDSAWREDVAVAAIALQPFVILLAATFLLHGISPRQLAAADPLIQILGPAGFPALIVACLGLGGGWWIAVRPQRPARQRGLGQGLAALVTVALGLPLVRLVIGRRRPSIGANRRSD